MPGHKKLHYSAYKEGDLLEPLSSCLTSIDTRVSMHTWSALHMITRHNTTVIYNNNASCTLDSYYRHKEVSLRPDNPICTVSVFVE